MMESLPKIPEQIVRLAIVSIVLIGGVLVVRGYVIPSSLKETGIHRTSTIEREVAKEIKYGGVGVCRDCHEEELDAKKEGYHRNLSCETCHGPSYAHTQDPDEIAPAAPRQRKFCPLCHEYDPSRPTGFPQMNPYIHNPMKPCINCHDPHDPKPPQIPQECTACHAEIVWTKAVSHHALIECTTCHSVPQEHRVMPRLIRPTKPDRRDFCGKCHGEGSSEVKEAPKIDLATHWGKYVCWQCHYPHMPEAR